ncbi:hypothetical protein EI77_00124 [Prosthecobacter fusiformis]|uniref:FG-GAP repeat protein n=1 Tax=Prosthecobacter fusiformis TaxID=48464 RepID=A0A4R7SQY6_9BACT|nr:hypothetical protein [Prosthecobacter fusiformis]TDU80826.1 hypothetical protein EI77_00124 [Prosthecobacter fusiformis]
MKHTLKTTLLAAVALASAAATEARADFVVVGSQNDNRILTDTRWTRDNVYILGRVIFVANGAKLTIEPGTIIRGLPPALSGFAEEPGTLVTARGGKVIANGTVDAPIIFTSLTDTNVPGGAATVPTSFTNAVGTVVNVTATPASDLNNYAPGGPTGNNGFSKAGLWGGIIMSGRGHVAANTGNRDLDADGIWDAHADSLTENFRKIQNAGVGTDFPEGLSSGSGSTVLNGDLAIYGGTDDTDDSGVLRYVVNRYGGFVIGAAAVGNEINGITLCGVGSSTVIEHVEVYQNKDDGFEWFGGKHDTRFLFSSSNQDDSFDGDEGFRGNHQFWTVIQGTINSSGNSLRSGHDGLNTAIGQVITGSDYSYDKLMEWDGGEPDNGDRLPMTDLSVFNFTMLAGSTKREGMNPKLEAHLAMHNGVVENTSTMNKSAETGGGSITTMLTWSNLYAFIANGNNGDGTLVNSSTVAVGSTTATVGGVVIPFLTQINTMQTPGASQLRTPWRFSTTSTPVVPCPLYTKNGLDPRLNPAGAAYNVPYADDERVVLPEGFVNAAFAGSMRDNNQMFGWTSLAALDVFPTTNLARPVITLDVSDNHPSISFPTAGADIKYVIEKSVDGRSWSVVTTNPVSDATTVSYTDESTDADESVLYRVYGL